jgi:hypothetical protein
VATLSRSQSTKSRRPELATSSRPAGHTATAGHSHPAGNSLTTGHTQPSATHSHSQAAGHREPVVNSRRQTAGLLQPGFRPRPCGDIRPRRVVRARHLQPTSRKHSQDQPDTAGLSQPTIRSTTETAGGSATDGHS